ncbi:MAG: C-GCAxxG-C-C family protein [Clostridiales bacterium]|nr:C-GCAxxG-C-C family protein [Clostridiales bacterium]
MSKYADRAAELRAIAQPHYNCGQSTAMPFAPDKGISEETMQALCANFGSGLKRKSTCGALAGGVLILGLYGVNDQETIDAYYKAFADNHDGMLDCGPLVADNEAKGNVQKPFCDGLVLESVGLVEAILKERGLI